MASTKVGSPLSMTRSRDGWNCKPCCAGSLSAPHKGANHGTSLHQGCTAGSLPAPLRHHASGRLTQTRPSPKSQVLRIPADTPDSSSRDQGHYVNWKRQQQPGLRGLEFDRKLNGEHGLDGRGTDE